MAMKAKKKIKAAQTIILELVNDNFNWNNDYYLKKAGITNKEYVEEVEEEIENQIEKIRALFTLLS